MLRTYFLLFLFSCLGTRTSQAQVRPANNSTVNCVRVYLQDLFQEKASRYELAFYTDSSHAANEKADKTATSNLPAFYVDDLQWSHVYFWRVKAYDSKNRIVSPGTVRRFTLAPLVSSLTFDEIKLEVKTNQVDSHLGGYFCVDYAKSIIDRSGKTIWVVPDIGKLQNKETQVRDLKVTNDNSFTFLTNNVPLEIDYDGNILWQLPHPFVFENDTITFHHDFQKINADSYFILGNKKVYRRVIGEYNEKQKTNKGLVYRHDTAYKRTEMAVLFEFDAKGQVRWFWDASAYITDDDLNFKKNPGGFPIFLTHANGFSINTEGSKIYLSFKELSRIVRIDKQTKTVDRSYGAKFPSGEAQWGDGLFMQQHDPSITSRNSILLFNNNEVRNKTSISSILEIRENLKPGDSLLLWRFDLNFDSLTKGKSVSGGNLTEMPNGSIFLCAGQLNRMFEIRKNGNLVWDLFLWSKRYQDSLWQPFSQYRASWLPDFRPLHYLLALEKSEKATTGGRALSLRIHNTGGSTENFIVKILDKNGKVLNILSSDPVKEKSSMLIPLDLVKQENKPFQVLVYPVSTPYEQQKINLNID